MVTSRWLDLGLRIHWEVEGESVTVTREQSESSNRHNHSIPQNQTRWVPKMLEGQNYGSLKVIHKNEPGYRHTLSYMMGRE